MAGERDVRELLEAILDSQLTPEEVCQGDPQLLTQVRRACSICARSRPSSTRCSPRPPLRAPARQPQDRGSPNRLRSPVAHVGQMVADRTPSSACTNAAVARLTL